MRTMDEPEFLKLMQVEFEHIRKRLRGIAMISRGIVPNLVLSRRAVDRMLSAASQYMADETGEAMVGFIIEDDTPEGLPTIYVLDTISPDETAVRRSHTFQQGDALQDEIYLVVCRRIGHFPPRAASRDGCFAGPIRCASSLSRRLAQAARLDDSAEPWRFDDRAILARR